MLPENEAAWQRLGRLLADRRIEVGARYRNKNLFAEEREINRRMVWSVETGARDTYGKDTIRAIESAYALVPGSVERTVAGGPLEPLPVPGAARAAARPSPPSAAWDEGDPRDDLAARLFRGDTRHDRLIRNIWRLGEAYDTDTKERIAMIRVVDPQLADDLEDVAGQSEAGLQCAPQSHVQCNESVTSGLSGYHRTVPVRDD